MFESHAAEADMIQVFQPFEERDGDTTTVHKHVGNDQLVAFVEQYFVSCWRGWAVCCFSDYLYRSTVTEMLFCSRWEISAEFFCIAWEPR